MYSVYGEIDIVKVINLRTKCLGHLFREKKIDSCPKVTLTKIDDKSKAGIRTIRGIILNRTSKQWEWRKKTRVNGGALCGQSRPAIGSSTIEDDDVIVQS